jgi:protein TonB
MLVRRILVPVDSKPVAQGIAPEALPQRPAAEGAAVPPRLEQSAGPPRAMLVGRMLVPVGAGAAPAERRTRRARDSQGDQAAAVRTGAPQATAAPRPAPFVEAMLENSPTKPKGLARDMAFSMTVHSILLAALLFIPLYLTETIDLQQFNRTLLVTPAPPAPAPPPPPAGVARPPVPRRRVVPTTNKLVAPRLVPNQIARPAPEPSEPDLPPGIAGGVPGGVPGGQAGGVIGGLSGGDAASNVPPPPSVAAPKSLRVGGDVKAPRLLSRVEPAYPLPLRRARVSGTVVIDAVIDIQGNVVKMRPVSGDRLLIPLAMDALRRWKYEPTILNGEAYPIELLVTIEFKLT